MAALLVTLGADVAVVIRGVKSQRARNALLGPTIHSLEIAGQGLGGLLRAEGFKIGFVLLWGVFELSPLTPLGISLIGWRNSRSTPDTSRFSAEAMVIKTLGRPDEVQPWDRWEYWARTPDGVVLVRTLDRGLCPQVLPRADLQQPDQCSDFTSLLSARVSRHPNDKPVRFN